MPRLSPARAESRRRQIAAAALACFARKGFHKSTMQDVIVESGLSAGAIYCHFAGKEDIVLAVVEERHRREHELLRAVAAQGDFAAGVDLLVRNFLEVLDDPLERQWRRLTVQLWAESLNDRRLRKAVREGFEGACRVLADFLRKSGAASTDADTTARVLVAAFQGLVLQHTVDGRVDTAAAARVLRGLLAPAAMPRRANKKAATGFEQA